MRPPTHTRVKVCCMKSIEEVWMAIEAEAAAVAPDVDAILLDSGNPKLEVKELGGTGRRHNWALSRQIRERLDVPVWLAGGLKPENAREAIAAVAPFALDVCSGLRSGEGYDLDPDKLARFMAAVGYTLRPAGRTGPAG